MISYRGNGRDHGGAPVRPEQVLTTSGAAAPIESVACAAELIPPKIFEPIGYELRIADRVLDILVSHPRLDRPGVMAGVCQRITAAVARHVRVDRGRPYGALTGARNQFPRRAALERGQRWLC
jgi:hypothetical protein